MFFFFWSWEVLNGKSISLKRPFDFLVVGNDLCSLSLSLSLSLCVSSPRSCLFLICNKRLSLKSRKGNLVWVWVFLFLHFRVWYARLRLHIAMKFACLKGLQLQGANFRCSLVDLYCMGLLKELDLGVDSQVFWGFLDFRVYYASLSIA